MNLRLRILTEKSVFDFGKYHGWTVQKLLDLRYKSFLKWAYFNLEKISFSESVLSQLGFSERIEKPGIDKELYKKIHFVDNPQQDTTQSIESIRNKIKYKKLNGKTVTLWEMQQLRAMKQNKRKQSFLDLRQTKGAMQAKNHGR